MKVTVASGAQVVLTNFSLSDFDSPGTPGSGKNMQADFLKKLQKARSLAGVAFIIKPGAGFRTKAYNDGIYARQGKKPTNSAHLRGYAADIATPDSVTRFKVLTALMAAGFTRIGIGRTFVHADCDPTLPANVMWHYY